MKRLTSTLLIPISLAIIVALWVRECFRPRYTGVRVHGVRAEAGVRGYARKPPIDHELLFGLIIICVVVVLVVLVLYMAWNFQYGEGP